MLDELIERYGEGAVVTARPYVLDKDDNVRWVVQIDGSPIPDADVRVAPDREHPQIIIVALVREHEEVVLARWFTTLLPHEPAGIVETLGAIRAQQDS